MTRPRKAPDMRTCQAALRWWREEGSPTGRLSHYLQSVLESRVRAGEEVGDPTGSRGNSTVPGPSKDSGRIGASRGRADRNTPV
jgi:hypothetical protein